MVNNSRLTTSISDKPFACIAHGHGHIAIENGRYRGGLSRLGFQLVTATLEMHIDVHVLPANHHNV